MIAPLTSRVEQVESLRLRLCKVEVWRSPHGARDLHPLPRSLTQDGEFFLMRAAGTARHRIPHPTDGRR